MEYLVEKCGEPLQNQIDLAIEYAARVHQDQKRKGTDTPYISHPYGVGMILLEAKCNEEVVIAGLLHDTLEDTDTTEEDIHSRFGGEVLRLVLGASEPDKTQSWEVRKEHTLEFLKSADLAIRQVACADKLHNLRSIRRDVEAHGDEVWSKFNRGFKDQKWYYTSMVESLGYTSRFSLLDTFQDEVEAFFLKLEFSTDKKECRRNEKFYDSVFEGLFATPERTEQLKDELIRMNSLDVKKSVFELIEGYRVGKGESFDKKQGMYRYLTSRGIEFENNSEGTDIIISACAAIEEILLLYPHEVYHHFYRNLKRGLL